MKKMSKVLTLVSSLALCAGFVGVGAYNLQADADTPDVYTHGGSVRKVDPTGLRFLSSVSSEYENAEIGTLIIPKIALGNQTLDHNTDGEDLSYIDVEKTQWANEAVMDMDGIEYDASRFYFSAVVSPIPDEFIGEVMVARAYVKTDAGYVYGDPVERSIAQVAAVALQAGEEDVNGMLVEYVDTALANKTLSMNVENSYMVAGNTQTLDVLNDNNYLATWTSSNESVATVDKNGKVTAVAEGEATITAKLGSKTVTAKVQVGSVIEGEKLVDFTAENISSQVKGGNANISYSNKMHYNGEGLLSVSNSINWVGSATLSNKVNVLGYSKIRFAVYQSTGHGRTVKVSTKDIDGKTTVALKSVQIASGVWTTFEVDVSGLPCGQSDIIFNIGTAGDNGSTGDTFYFTDIYAEKLAKVLDFTAENAAKQAKGTNANVGYSDTSLVNGDVALTVANSINWLGSATLAMNLSYHKTVQFSVYQKTTGGRFMKVLAQDTTGSYTVTLFNKTLPVGVWVNVSIDVSACVNHNSQLRFDFGTAGDNGNAGDTFYITDMYGEKLDKVVDFTVANVATEVKGGNANIGYSNDVYFNGESTLSVSNSINWVGGATLLNPVDVSSYSKIRFSVCQSTGHGRTVKVSTKDVSGKTVALKSVQISSGVWTTFEVDVSDLKDATTVLIFNIGTAGDNGNAGDTFYFSDIYGVK